MNAANLSWRQNSGNARPLAKIFTINMHIFISFFVKVLATDMSKHMDHLAHLKTMVETRRISGNCEINMENYNERIQVCGTQSAHRAVSAA